MSAKVEGAPECTSPEDPQARTSQLEAEHEHLNTEWKNIQQEVRNLNLAFPEHLQRKELDQIGRTQDHLKVLWNRAEQLVDRQFTIEQELFRAWPKEKQ